MPKFKVDELVTLHTEAKSADREAHAEMRSSILLIAGEHYTRKMTEWAQKARASSQPGDTYKLRITKNWLHRAHRIYMQSILGLSPGTSVSPRSSTELQDQKDSELNQGVWEWIKEQVHYKSWLRNMVSDYTGPGECAVKVFFDPNKGVLKGYEGAIDADGNPEIDEMGQPLEDQTKPVFEGEFVFERLYAHMLFRDPSAKQFSDAKWLGIEKMEDKKALSRLYKDDPEKLKYIQESAEEYVVFDASKGGYSRDKDQTLLLEYYFKPSLEYPRGYYYVATKTGILEEGELPFGIYPIEWCGFDEHPTKARATGIVKVARPWQAEINRASSQAAMQQVTIGEDKILYAAGTKVSQGALLPGVRGLTYQGAPPTILPGRSGDQYFQYIAMQEAEMNRALMIDLLDAEKASAMDPIALLYRSMDQTQKFSLYSAKFGEFLVRVTYIALAMAKEYLDDDAVIAAVGKSEAINIAEFRKTVPLRHRIHVVEQNDTIETKLGQQLVINHMLQYVGTQLSREDIGKLAAEMPFGNMKTAFSEFTQDSKNVKNDFLALERGETPPMSKADDSKYILKQVASRMKERDFLMLDPTIQDMYNQYEQYHEQKMAEEAQAIKQAQSEFIPTGGAMIACDMYVPHEDPNKAPKRVRVPYQSLDWMLKLLEQQGMTTQAMEQMNQSQVSEVAQMISSGGGQPNPSLPPNGQASPGVM